MAIRQVARRGKPPGPPRPARPLRSLEPWPGLQAPAQTRERVVTHPLGLPQYLVCRDERSIMSPVRTPQPGVLYRSLSEPVPWPTSTESAGWFDLRTHVSFVTVRDCDMAAGWALRSRIQRVAMSVSCLQCIGQQCAQRLKLHVGGRGGLAIRSVQRAGGEPRLAVDQRGDPGVNGLRGDDAPGRDRFGLPDTVASVDGLGLFRVGPGKLGQHDVRGDLQIQAYA